MSIFILVVGFVDPHRDEDVAEAGFAALGQDLDAQSSCPFAMARFDLDQRQVRESAGHA